MGPCRWLALRSPLWHLSTRPAIENRHMRTGHSVGPGLFAIERFVEEPDAEAAARYVAGGAPRGHTASPRSQPRSVGADLGFCSRLGEYLSSVRGWADARRSGFGDVRARRQARRPKPPQLLRPGHPGVVAPIHRALDVRDDLTGIRLVPAPAPNGFGPRDVTPGPPRTMSAAMCTGRRPQNYRRRCRLFRPTRS